jgi:hypothetical protein
MRIKTGWAAHTDGTRKHGKIAEYCGNLDYLDGG